MRKVTVSIPVPEIHPTHAVRTVAAVPLTVTTVVGQKASRLRKDVHAKRDSRKLARTMKKMDKQGAKIVKMNEKVQEKMAFDFEQWPLLNSYWSAHCDLQQYGIMDASRECLNANERMVTAVQGCLDYIRLTSDVEFAQAFIRYSNMANEQNKARMTPEEWELVQAATKDMVTQLSN